MRFILPVLMLLSAPVMAQQPQPMTAREQAYQFVAQQAVEREAGALTEVVNLRQQITAMQAQIEALKSPKPPTPTVAPAPDSK